jgi:hypothetical protein
MKIFKSKAFLVTFVAVLAISFIWSYLNQEAPRTRAAATPVNISFNPSSGSFDPNANQTLQVIVQPQDSGKGVSGFDLTFTATGATQLVDIGSPTNLDGQNSGTWAELVKEVSPTSIRIANVFFDGAKVENQPPLPTAFRIPLTFKGAGPGSGTLSINQTPSIVTGNTPEYNYSFGTVDSGTYNFVAEGPTVTPAPTANPTATPPPGVTPSVTPGLSCPRKPQGDANCRDKVDILDFLVWKAEFVKGCKATELDKCEGDNDNGFGTVMDADFNNDQEVNILDFLFWKATFITEPR